MVICNMAIFLGSVRNLVISTIYSKQGREVQLSSRKLAIGQKIWIFHLVELEKLLVPKLFNFRSRFFLLLNLAFSKKSRFWVFSLDRTYDMTVHRMRHSGADG